jgi:hypothetical protein
MKIDLNQTKDDLVSFYQFDRWYSDDKKNYRLKTRLIWGTVTTIPFWLIVLNADSDDISSIMGLIILGLFFFFIGFFGVKYAVLSNLRDLANKIANDKDNNELMGLKSMEFTTDRISWASQFGQGQCAIETIKKVKSDSKYYYLYNTSLSAYVIPKKTFQTDNEKREFEDIIKSYSNSTNLQ